MATASQLEIYKIILPKSIGSFGEFIQSKFYKKTSHKQPNRILFTKLYKEFLKPLTKNSIWECESQKKGLTIFKSSPGQVNEIVKANSEAKVIEGFIDGGRYNLIRKLSKMTDNTRPRDIGATDIVAARYYFYLYIPLDKAIAVLFLEKKRDYQINDAFKKYLSQLFRYKNACRIDPYIPPSMIKEYKDGAVVESLTSIDYYSSPTGGDDETMVKCYEVSVTVKPIGKATSYEDLGQLENEVRALKVSFLEKTKNFISFKKRKATIKNVDTKKTSTFDYEKGESIRPIVEIDDDWISDSLVDRKRIKTLCDQLLDEIKGDIYGIK